MKLIVGQAPAPVPITEAPSVPCEMTPEMAEFLGVPDLAASVFMGLNILEDAQPPRALGLHATDMGYSRDGGHCARQLWLRLGHEEDPDVVRPQPAERGRRLGWARGHETETWVARLLQRSLPGQGWLIDERNGICDYVHLASGVIFTGEFDLRLTNGTLRVIVDVKEVDDHALKRLDAPRPSNVCQVQTYVTADNADFGALLYMARWGVKAFYVPRDDVAVDRRAIEVNAIYESPDAPEALKPKVERKKNVGPDSIKVSLPWQCDYCPFLDHSCDGALPKKMRGLGIWGHLGDSGVFKPKIDEALVREFTEIHDGEEMWT